MRTAGWAGSARAAGRRPPGDVGCPQNRAPHTESGRGRPPPTGAFSTLLRQSGLRASTGGVLVTKSERKMLASTCLYSLCAWLVIVKKIAHGFIMNATVMSVTSAQCIACSNYISYTYLVVCRAGRRRMGLHRQARAVVGCCLLMFLVFAVDAQMTTRGKSVDLRHSINTYTLRNGMCVYAQKLAL